MSSLRILSRGTKQGATETKERKSVGSRCGRLIMTLSLSLLLLLLDLSLSPRLAAFNLDTRSALLKKGSQGSLFGFSVALHQRRGRRFLLLVGAPKEEAEPDVAANQTGGVFSCPISNKHSDCTRMNLIGADLDLNEDEDMVEDMWLGVSVASQKLPGGRVLACGHRFIKLYGAFKLRHMIGRCYLRGNDLQYDPDEMHWQNADQVCSHLGQTSNEVMCNSGVAVDITQSEVIVGSPGSFDWQGNVHVSWRNPDVMFDAQHFSFPDMERRHAYIGYSVLHATRLLSLDTATIVTGAPRSGPDAAGSVLLSEKKQDGRSLTIRSTLIGEQMGSYYGNSLAVADLNKDGWSDLLVGAPYFFLHQGECGGAVYVYLNLGGSLSPQASVRLLGPPGSGFGLALAAIGDINQDGYQDFAVGAPFHQTGSVHIWTGGAEGVAQEASQVIEGRHVSSSFTTFGFSLSGGGDVDQNLHPDLLVGSLDHTVALLRARPVIHLHQTLSVTPEIVNSNDCEDCIQVEVCFSLLGNQSFSSNFTLHFTVEADVAGHSSRLRFLDNRQEVYSDFLSMPNQCCKKLRVTLVKPVWNLVLPLVFRLNVSLKENRRRNEVEPILSQNQSPTTSTIHLLKSCGFDNRCHSNLQMTAQFTDQELIPLQRRHGVQLFRYNSSIKFLYLVVEVTNLPLPGQQVEDAHNVVLNVTLTPSLEYYGVRSQGSYAVAQSSVDGVLLCEFGNPLPSKQKVQILIIYQVSDLDLETTEIHTLLQLSTFSEQSHLRPVSLSLLLEYSIHTTFTVTNQRIYSQFGGHVIRESPTATTGDDESPLHFTFKVEVLGKPLGRHGNLEVEFDWPLESSNGKRLLDLQEIFLEGASESRCAGGITQVRKKRSVDEDLNLQRREKTYTLECARGSARCARFLCRIPDVETSATLNVRGRLWDPTLLEDYSDAWSVEVKGRATLKLQTKISSLRMKPCTLQWSVYVRARQRQGDAPLWILMLSALTGLLLLAALCILLWKCGFFLQGVEPQGGMALHQGRIVDKAFRTDTDSFHVQDDITSSRKRKWITTWTHTQIDTSIHNE